MMQRLSAAVFLGTLIQTVADRTGGRCVDCPDNEPSPFYSVELLQVEPTDSSKTMFLDRYDVRVHCISEAVEPYSNAPVLRMVQTLEEAMALRDLELPSPFYVFRTDYAGLRALKRDESGEGHAVLDFSFYVVYGYKCK